jgi:hypothetical protein
MAVAKINEHGGIRWWCPGCKHSHIVPVKQYPNRYTTASMPPDGWDWDGSLDAPTLSPSVLVYGRQTFINSDLEGDALTAPENLTMTPRCHTFVTGGRIEFLPDCTHELAGQTVDMEDIER